MKTKKIYKNRNKINESRNLETKKKKESFNIWRAFNFFIENESGKDGGQITYRMYFR
jgi:hypothetical protein